MSRRENGVNILTLLEIGSDELQWLQAELQYRQDALRMARMALPGWFGYRKNGPNGANRYGWRIDEDGTTGALRVQTILGTGTPTGLGTKIGNQLVPPRFGGMLPSGKILEIKHGDNYSVTDTDDAVIVVPDDATWYTLVAVHETTVIEPGTLQLVQNSSTITGTFTDFTRYSSTADDPVPTVIRIDAADSANGNEGTYTVLTIVDSETMTVSPSPPGADETVHFRIKGRFFTPPGVGDEQDAHLNARLVWELRARVDDPPSDALVAYDVYRDTGLDPNVFIIERRQANEYRPMPSPGDPVSTRLMAIIDANYTVQSTPTVGFGLNVFATNVGSAALLEFDMAPSANDAFSNILYATSGGFSGMCIGYVTAAGVNSYYSGQTIISAVDGNIPSLTIAQASITGFSIEQIAGGIGGNTHLCAYSSGGKIRVARSDDNGATFTVDGVVWDPATIDALDTVNFPAVLFTKWGRILIAGVYFDDSAGTESIRYIYSDDYGDSWTTGSDAGGMILNGSTNPRHIEMVQDGWGNIQGFYIEDNGAEDELWSWVGTDQNNPAIDADKAPTANRGALLFSVIAGANDFGQPRAVGFEDGTVAVAVGATTGAAGNGLVYLVHVKEYEILRIEAPLTTDTADYAGPTHPPCGLEALNGGQVLLAGVDTDATANGDMLGLHMVPAAVSGTPAWPGGR